MDYPGPPSYPGSRPSADQPEPDGFLAELDQAQVALMIAEYHIRLWRANSPTGDVPFRAFGASAAHEALDDAGRVIDRIAEMLRIEAAGALTTPHLDHPAQIHTEVPPTDTACREPAYSGDHAAHREWVAVVPHVDSGGME